MSALIVLSSSPPQVFARSPTPADSSSPALPSTNAILKGDSPGRRKFKTRSTLRDGCAPGFSTARQVLAEKGGAENIPIVSPSRYRFRQSPTKCEKVDAVESIKTKQPTLPRPISKVARITQPKTAEKHVKSKVEAEFQPAEGPIVIQIAKKDVRRTKKRAQSPLLLEKAATRKTDWTPPKPVTVVPTDFDSAVEARTFPSNLLGSFGFAVPEDNIIDYKVDSDNPAKRRKLSGSDFNNIQDSRADVVPQLLPTVAAKSTSKRSRSPAKKPLTITALATSKFADSGEPEPTALLQYLTGSQAPLGESTDAGVLDEKVTKTKAALRKIRENKKGSKKSLLVSPSSAMRSFEEQEAIFGSASQLARDESPTLLKDTIEAIKLSESSFSCNPSSPLQPTQADSVELTPQTGTSRFRKARNLWAAAGRDDDNALLHIDTIDLTDTPAIRNVFAGKDVLVQPNFLRSVSPLRKSPTLRGGYTPITNSRSGSFMDIDDIVSPVTIPALPQTSALHTSARSTSPEKPLDETSKPIDASEPQVEPAMSALPKPAVPKKRTPKKPNYAGFTDNELKKQVSAYGFKAVKKRDKMIELLERCWDEKHGSSTDVLVDAQTETTSKGPGYGDFLSNVHDVSARPVPKVIKPKVPRKKKEAGGTDPSVKKPRASRKKKDETLDENGVPLKKPRAPRKKKESKEEGAVPRTTVRKQKPKTGLPPVEDTLPKCDMKEKDEGISKQAAQDSAGLEPLVGELSKDSVPSAVSSTAATCHLEQTLDLEDSPSKLAATISTQSESLTEASALVLSPALFDIQKQITKAIKHQSLTSRTHTNPPRDHQKNPTWHEKILMYDPIILENLATWLNTEGLGVIGEDREISALDVRTWCESRGICCLWKGGWRGNKVKDE